MIKTNESNPAKFSNYSKALIAYGILREYLKRPLGFVLWSLLTLSQFKRKLPKNVSSEYVEIVALDAWMYIRLKKMITQESALALMRAVIIPVEMSWYGAQFRMVEESRTYENIIKFHELVHEKMIKEDANLQIEERSDHKYTYKNTFCPIYDLFKKIGIPELTEPYCAIDNGLYNIYLPGEIIFHRGGLHKTIASGAPYCQYIYEHFISDSGEYRFDSQTKNHPSCLKT